MIKGFQSAMQKLGINGDVQVSDTDPLSPGLRFCEKHHMVPLSTARNYIPAILQICRDEKIGLVVPTIDEELPVFAKSQKLFADNNIQVLISSESTIETCIDKYKTARFFTKNGFPFADTFLPEEIDPAKTEYPLFIKPRKGRASIGVHPVANEKELRFFSEYVESPIVQNRLTGAEYTIDVLADSAGTILSVVPRERLVIRAGVCDRGKTSNDKELIDIAYKICDKLRIAGPVNLQCMVDENGPRFFEINARFSGAIQLTVAAGADFFVMILKDALGIKQKPAIGDFKDNCLMISYENSIFENGQK